MRAIRVCIMHTHMLAHYAHAYRVCVSHTHYAWRVSRCVCVRMRPVFCSFVTSHSWNDIASDFFHLNFSPSHHDWLFFSRFSTNLLFLCAICYVIARQNYTLSLFVFKFKNKMIMLTRIKKSGVGSLSLIYPRLRSKHIKTRYSWFWAFARKKNIIKIMYAWGDRFSTFDRPHAPVNISFWG